MRTRLTMLLLSPIALGCADPGAADDRDEARSTAQVVDPHIDGGGARLDAALADAGASEPAADASAVPDATTEPGTDDPCRGVTPSTADGPALHGAAAELLTAQTPCGFSSCHLGSSRARAGLRLLGAPDLRTLLVDKPACEAPALPLVDGSGGAAALARSWLWQKLAAPVDASGALRVDPAWGASAACGQDPAEPFGLQMPLSAGSLEEVDLAVVRSWICAGAPGPT